MAEQVVTGLAGAGYTRRSVHDQFTEGGLTTYKPEPRLSMPDIGFTITEAGSVISGTDAKVPEGHTGVYFVI